MLIGNILSVCLEERDVKERRLSQNLKPKPGKDCIIIIITIITIIIIIVIIAIHQNLNLINDSQSLHVRLKSIAIISSYQDNGRVLMKGFVKLKPHLRVKEFLGSSGK